ncbi:DUF6735 family protein [Haloarculaceae archaeon H-GB2-1]|nr:hypothetical protein [Haloarculaceae archaeon H-GB1-1]MEA5388223.1 DUF6735 family protein [Haloarculaceae archaeon H-GB11]MEA5406245.1 DUF6735 family protein [Haloarculaceae archaeon H-GB2-1]
MGHRALVAYERPDGWACHRSQWGAHQLRLQTEVTAETPFGRPPDDPPVEQTPRRRVESFDEVVAAVDFLAHEAIYVVDSAFAVTSYVAVWLGVETGASNERDPSDGVCVAVADDAEAETLRRRIRVLKTVLGRAVDDGRLDEAVASRRLERRVRALAGDRRVLP